MMIQPLRTAILGRFPESTLTQLDASELETIRNSHPGMPDDYLDLLGTLGWGGIGDSLYMLYSCPVSAADLFALEPGSDLAEFLLVGDDLAGWHHGYDTSTSPWRFVALDHAALDRPDYSVAASISDFLWWFLIDGLPPLRSANQVV